MPDKQALRALAERWAGAKAAERANFPTYLIELCDALGMERPGPAGGGYQFEQPIRVITRDGIEVANFIDCYRQGYFAIEAKDDEAGQSDQLLLRKAFGQVRNYVTSAPGGLPPYIMVMNVARTLIVWDRWTGTYGDWQAGRRIDLLKLADNEADARFLHTIWTDPHSLDTRSQAQKVTKEVAGWLADLARSLEKEGYEQERVARFIMRCVFTMFAEDIGLLPDEPFRQLLERCQSEPDAFPEQAEALWKAMDKGGKFLFKKLPHFNGHFFNESEALPLKKDGVAVLGLAAAADWKEVEPAIFGTLLTRALDPAERHRLGAEFTPREFVERVVRPTVEEPIRERWRAVQAEVLQLEEEARRLEAAGKSAAKAKKDAEKKLREFHAWLKGLRFLDPACGSGNFLYVTMHIVKLVELELLRELDDVTGKHELLLDDVHPRQFFGIEIKPWAREIAELVLWIGYHQFWRAHHDRAPKEPILEDTHTIECRDAVLTWDDIRHDAARDRPDPTPRIQHPVTGRPVPDPSTKLEYNEYLKARPAGWPEASFIVGNPPYIGNKLMRDALGDGYVDALRSSYADVPESVDYVMYWWQRAARRVADGRTTRAGMITTNSITQVYGQAIVNSAREGGARVVWAIPDHPWVDDADGAAVRVALTVLARESGKAVRVEVDERGMVTREQHVTSLNADLSAHADVAASAHTNMLGNAGLSSRGFTLVGRGFVLSDTEASRLVANDRRNKLVIRQHVSGKDLASRRRGVFVIDFGLMDEEEARRFPLAFDLVRDRVQPERLANGRPSYRDRWWRFGEPRAQLRPALTGLDRFIATVYVSKQRFFAFLDTAVAPDETVVAIAIDDPYVLAVLSSRLHLVWALAAGGTLEDRPRYNNSRCFDPFPFPDPPPELRAAAGAVAEKLDAHRRGAIDRDESVTMTGMYNVVEKLRSGEALTDKERRIHETAACGVLKDLHDELDALVAKAYGWEWPLTKEVILERLVKLHDERVKEEKAGKVRWLRPDYQIRRFGQGLPAAEPGLGLVEPAPAEKRARKPGWPTDVISQILAMKRLLAEEALSATEMTARFTGAKADMIQRQLGILEVMGEVTRNPDGRFQATGGAAV